MKRTLRELTFGMVACLAIGLSVDLLAAPAAPPAKGRIAPGPLAISITDVATGKPTEGIRVQLGGRYAFSDAKGAVVLDGVPAGQYSLVLTHPAYDRLTAALPVVAGARTPVKVRLKKTALVNFPGTVHETKSGRSLAGAEIRLTPKAVAASVQGPVRALTEWDGTFLIRAIPAGVYTYTVSAIGTTPQQGILTIPAGGKTSLGVRLFRIESPASATVVVKDAQTGKVIPGAKVTLAECYPAGVLATTATDAKGVATVSTIVAALNLPSAKLEQTATSGVASIHASAKGYESNTAPVRLTPSRKATVTVLLNSTAPLVEREPNDAPGQATPIHTSALMTFKQAKPGDKDYFRLRVERPRRIKFTLTTPKAQGAVFQILYADGRLISQTHCAAGRAYSTERFLPAGNYFVYIQPWGRSTGPGDYTLLATTYDLAEPNEPNKTPTQARPLAINAAAHGTLIDSSDKDYLRFKLATRSRVRLSSPSYGCQWILRVFNSQKKVLYQNHIGAKRPVTITMQLPAGSYSVEASPWGNTHSTGTPYRLELAAISDDGTKDMTVRKGRRLSANRTLAPGNSVTDTLERGGDIDLYAIPIPSRGHLYVTTQASEQTITQLFSGASALLSQTHIGAARSGVNQYHADHAGVVYLSLRQWGALAGQGSPYRVQCWFVPSDELDLIARNDTPSQATPVETGVIRGSCFPQGDMDYYRIHVDHPGWLRAKLTSPHNMIINMRRADTPKQKNLHQHHIGANRVTNLRWPVTPGDYLVSAQYWGGSKYSGQYHLEFSREWADPRERLPLATDPTRLLTADVAAPLQQEHNGDVDHFRFAIAQKGKYYLKLSSPVNLIVSQKDPMTGKVLHNHHLGTGGRAITIDASGPQAYLYSVQYWGNSTSMTPGWIMLTADAKAKIPGVNMTATVSPTNPTRATFAADPKQLARAKSLVVYPNYNAPQAFAMPRGRAVLTYPREGVYCAKIVATGADGRKAESLCWVDATGPRERKGLLVRMSQPGVGQIVSHDIPCVVNALSYEGTAIRGVTLTANGQLVGRDYTAPYEFKVPWRDILSRGGGVKLVATAVDSRGNTKSATSEVRLSDYFDFYPAGGETITGNTVRVSWLGPKFGSAVVDYRPVAPKGKEQPWARAVGQNARHRMVILDNLEASKPYEFRAVGGKEPSEIRTVTRVKGLAFSDGVYSANILRDYDQRVGITVRNHGEKPLTVKLQCGDPNSKLLVGFVGEGSEGAPVVLLPNENRVFLLGLSAQNVIRETQEFPIYITSTKGLSDQATVRVKVKLPVVKLKFEPLGDLKDGLGTRLRLRNLGDTLTDLRLSTTEKDLAVSPSMEHGLLERGASIELLVTPNLHEGFSSVTGLVEAHAIGKTVSSDPIQLALPAGEKVFSVTLHSGMKIAPETPAGGAAAAPAPEPTADEQEALDEEMILGARMLTGAYLNPDHVDWTKRTQPKDVDGDGKFDSWEVFDEAEQTLWIGEDTDANGTIDFVHADIGSDGQFEFSAYRTADGKSWKPTNIVDAWLEMAFKLPWARKAYEKHDLDVVLNGIVVAKLRNQIPEGNYTFRLPPAVLVGAQKLGPRNVLEIRSKHLRGGHYVVNSDFKVKLRLTGTRLYSTGKTLAEATRRVLATPGLQMSGADYSISSAETQVESDGAITKGKPVSIQATIRNLGSSGPRQVTVALMRFAPGAKTGLELARVMIDSPGLMGEATATLPWTAAAGNHQLQVVVDPDERYDTNRENNVAVVNLTVAGKNAPPTATVVSPKSGATLDKPLTTLWVKAADDDGVALVEASLDGGLYTALVNVRGAYRGLLLAQPGRHTLTVRVSDSGGSQVTTKTPFTVTGKTPTLTISSPAAGAKLSAATCQLNAAVGPDVALTAWRVNKGPWHSVGKVAGKIQSDIPVPFGKVTLDVLAADAAGHVTTQSVRFQSTAQPLKETDVVDSAGGDGVITVPLIGRVNLFAPANRVLQPEAYISTEAGMERVTPEQFRYRIAYAALTGERDLLLEFGPDLAMLELGPDLAMLPGVGRHVAREVGRNHSKNKTSGGMIGVNQKVKDWYCTNRPRVKIPFRLPKWPFEGDPPKPGTKEFHKWIAKLMKMYKRKGYDMSKLERFQASLLKRIRNMDQPGELPTFLQSIGFGSPKPSDPVKLVEWRAKMMAHAQAWWLRALATGNPKTVAAALKARNDSLRKFDEAAADHANASIDMIKANQEFAEEIIESIPVVDNILDLYAVTTGETALSGREVTAFERTLRLAGILPMGTILKKIPGAESAMKKLAELAQVGGKAAKAKLAKLLGMSKEAAEKGFKKISDAVGDKMRKNTDEMLDKAEDAARGFSKSADGLADKTIRQIDTKRALDQLDQLKNLPPNSPEFRKLALEIQTNKTAQGLINNKKLFGNNLRESFNKSMKDIYKKTDDLAETHLKSVGKATDGEIAEMARMMGKNSDEVKHFEAALKKQRGDMEKLAKKHGIPVEDLKVKANDFSGNDLTSVGRDRDVTYQILGKDGKVIGDVHHDVSKNIYETNLWRETKGPLPMKTLPDGTKVVDMSKVSKNATELDQAVTSKWHPEAYNTGKEVPFDDFLAKGKTPTLTRPEDIAATLEFKSKHWFDSAKKAGPGVDAAIKKSQDVAEGMRQATKQWDRIVEPRVTKYFADPSIAKNLKVPSKLQAGMDIFKKVKDGGMSPAQAEHALKAIGSSKEAVVRQMGAFVEGMEKTVGKNFRKLKTAALKDAVSNIPAPKGTANWGSEAFARINGALKKGEVAGETFMKMRTDVFRGMQDSAVKGGKAGVDGMKAWCERMAKHGRVNADELAQMTKWADTTLKTMK